ncbi:MAG: DUF4190 domain-containing protein [Lachnospiraceae bacterium]|nr:DUF4190 domain-containing protein [Lachnospiraceae bacterium]
MDENKNENRAFTDDYFQDESTTRTSGYSNTTETNNSYGSDQSNEYGNYNGQNPYGDNFGNNGRNPYGGYNENPYNNQNNYNRDYGQNDKKVGFGIASLVLGIISLVFFCSCINVITGVLAIIFGIIQIAKGKGMGKGMAIAGIITAVISIIMCFVFWAIAGSSAALTDSILKEYEQIYDLDLSDPDDVEQFLEQYTEDGSVNEIPEVDGSAEDTL